MTLHNPALAPMIVVALALLAVVVLMDWLDTIPEEPRWGDDSDDDLMY